MGATNPTQLLGKSAVMSAWDSDVVLCSETSHTKRAVRAISAEFRSVGLSVGLCRPVPDKFEVGDVLGSFRLSRGCGMVSRFPLYSFESPVIDGRFWESNRFFFGELAICMVTLYLWPMHLWPLADTWRTVR